MLTRLKVSGFKNLVDVDIRFGPFTCIAGPNAVGKSNLFDAIRFLACLADDTLLNAALSIRSEGGKSGDVRSLFHRVGARYADRMSFEAELILPAEGVDDLGQKAEATITLVRYRLVLGYREHVDLPTLGTLELITEDLEHINLGDAPHTLQFPHSAAEWRRSVLNGRRTSPFISTIASGDGARIVKLSQDGRQGRPKQFRASDLPRTVLSTVNAMESPTALIVRREMQSWRLLQLEPSALREPDAFVTPPGLAASGAHLPATLYYLARLHARGQENREWAGDTWVYDQVAARLSDLIGDIHHVAIDRDEKRELLTLEITDRDGTNYPARSLSDGTLRFLALAAIDLDASAGGVFCLEEPENGIHPVRMPAMIRLLQDIACDVSYPVGPDNPLRQVIINTHSPVVVQQIPDDSLLVALLVEKVEKSERFRVATFRWLPDTWRSIADPVTPPVTKGDLLAYLSPIEPADVSAVTPGDRQPRRVIDRPDLQLLLPFPEKQYA